MIRALFLLAFGAAAAIGIDRLVLSPAASTEAPPPVADSEPGPGDPPVVWLDGTLESIAQAEMALRVGQGPRVPIERFAAGATAFLLRDGDGWRELSGEETGELGGRQACVETLLDGGTFLAIRVFLDAECGPAVGA